MSDERYFRRHEDWERQSRFQGFERIFPAPDRPEWIAFVTVIFFLVGLVWMFHDLNVRYDRSDQAIMTDWAKVKRDNPDLQLPDRPKPEPIGPEQMKFEREVIDPIIKEYQSKRSDQLQIPDYFEMMDRVNIACAENFATRSYVGGGGMMSDWNHIQVSAMSNSSRLDPDYMSTLTRCQKKSEAISNHTRRVCGAVLSVPFTEYRWGNFWRWMPKAYLRGMILTMFIFLLRLLVGKKLRDELLIAPGRVCKMLFAWPVGIFIYPYQTEPATVIKRQVLEIQLLRGKPLEYRFTAEEEAYLDKACRLPFVDFRKALALIASEQRDVRRHSVAVVCFAILWFSAIGAFSKATAAEPHHVTSAQIVAGHIDSLLTMIRSGPIGHAFEQYFGADSAVLPEMPSVEFEQETAVMTEYLFRMIEGEALRDDPVPNFLLVFVGWKGMKPATR